MYVVAKTLNPKFFFTHLAEIASVLGDDEMTVFLA